MGGEFGERKEEVSCWDEAHIASTYSSLTALISLGDDLSRVQNYMIITHWLVVGAEGAHSSGCEGFAERGWQVIFIE